MNKVLLAAAVASALIGLSTPAHAEYLECGPSDGLNPDGTPDGSWCYIENHENGKRYAIDRAMFGN